VRGRVGERLDDRQELDDRAGPAVRHEQRQRVVMLRTDVRDWMSSPSVSVMNCGSALSVASTLRQS
jgi:hypothetical protein